MILFTGLLLTLIVAMITFVFVALVGSAGFIVVFSDIIVCVAIIVWIVKRLLKKK